MNESHRKSKLARTQRPVKKKETVPLAAARSMGVSVSKLAPGYYTPPTKLDYTKEAARHFNPVTNCFEYMYGRRTITKREFLALVRE